MIETIQADLHALGADLDGAATAVAEASEDARYVAERIAAVGFSGIAEAVARARSMIDAILPRTGAVTRLLEQARSRVAMVKAQPTPEQSIGVLQPVLDILHTVRNGVDQAVTAADRAKERTAGALQGGQPGPLLARLDAIRETLVVVAARSTQISTQVEFALAEARTIGSGNSTRPTDNSPENPSVSRTVPQGLTIEQFRGAVDTLRTGTAHIAGELFVHGSRAGGTARPDSDIDFGVRVTSERFDQLVTERFGRPNPGSAKERTMQWASRTGKIQSGEAGLSRVRRQLEAQLDMDVDLSIVRRDGPFDTRPCMEISDD